MMKDAPQAPLMIITSSGLHVKACVEEAALGAGAVVDQEPEFIGALRVCE